MLHECRGASSSARRHVLDAVWQGLWPSTSAPISLPVPVGAGRASEDLEAACTDSVELGIDVNVEHDEEAPPTPTA